MELSKIDLIIESVEDMHPYKQSGNRESYSQYNEGWSDACDILGNKLKPEIDNLIKEKLHEFIDFHNESHPDKYIPNSELGLFLNPKLINK